MDVPTTSLSAPNSTIGTLQPFTWRDVIVIRASSVYGGLILAERLFRLG